MDEYGTNPERFGAVMDELPAGERDERQPGHHHLPEDPMVAEGVYQPVKIDNELYVRDYSRCILCYKCVEACGVDAQNTFAIAVAGRGFDARISTEWNVGLPDSACVYCGNCIGVCPTGALMFKSEHDMRAAGTWDESSQSVTSTIWIDARSIWWKKRRAYRSNARNPRRWSAGRLSVIPKIK